MNKQNKTKYAEKDIALPRSIKETNVVKLKGKIIGYWLVVPECEFLPNPDSNLESFEAKSIYSLKKQLLAQLNKL